MEKSKSKFQSVNGILIYFFDGKYHIKRDVDIEIEVKNGYVV